MALEIERDCPDCGDVQTFWRSAMTELHLGQKTKWHCAECDFGLVRVNGIESAEA